MSKILKYFQLLKFALFSPKSGKYLLDSVLQSSDDRKSEIIEHQISPQNFDDCLNLLFPGTTLTRNKINENTLRLQNHINSFFDSLKNEKFPSKQKPYPVDYSLNYDSCFMLYAICKITRPKTVLETGTAYGLSSSFILQALDENKNGNLFSIDNIFRPWESKEMIGSIIPDPLRLRWNLFFGSSSDSLKNSLKKIENLDIFFHDSLHTYHNMMFEFKTVFPYIKRNGWILSDDIVDNNAFYDFYNSHDIIPQILGKSKSDKSSLGILHKVN